MGTEVMPVSIEIAKKYARIDYDEDDIILQILIKSADKWIMGAVGEKYDRTDERAELLALLLISDMYDNRTVSEKTGTNSRKLVDDLCMQLKLDLRKSVKT